MPAREIWRTSASVLVPRPLALIECSIPSASAVSTSSSKTLGERVEPRPIAGPGGDLRDLAGDARAGGRYSQVR